ncbi:MAG: hypothetical protein HQL81_04965 [Magnetococcales bacterium]|nr:hypothetical protein [Magnetococcales bacterium]MBF0631318.1 hypothetical protein [Magnetococcales bacterium]
MMNATHVNKQYPIFEIAIVLFIIIHANFGEIGRNAAWGVLGLAIVFLYLFLSSGRYLRYKTHHAPFIFFAIYYVFILPFISIAIGSQSSDFDFIYSLRHLTWFFFGAFFIFSFNRAYQILYILGRLMPVPVIWSLINPHEHTVGIALIAFSVNARFRKYFIPFLLIELFFLLFPNLILLDFAPIDSSSAKLVTIAFIFLMILPLIQKYRSLYSKNKVKNIRRFMIFIVVTLVIFYSTLGYIADRFNLMYPGTFVSISLNLSSYSEDTNILWRAAYWGSMLSRIPDNPFGLGIGRPFLPLDAGSGVYFFDFDPVNRGMRYEHYFTGPHNSFVTLLVFCGPFFLIPFLWMLWYTPLLVYRSLAAYTYDRKTGTILLALFLNAIHLLITSSVHVALESPTNAVMVWFGLGLWMRVAADWGNAGFMFVDGGGWHKETPLMWGDGLSAKRLDSVKQG